MNDLSGNILSQDTEREQSSLLKLVSFLADGRDFEYQIHRFVHLLSEEFFANRTFFFWNKEVEQILGFNTHYCKYGRNVKLFPDSNHRELLDQILKLKDVGYTSQVTNDVSEDTLKDLLQKMGVLSFALVRVQIGNIKIGHFLLVDEDTPRLWSQEQLNLSVTLGNIFGQYVSTHLMQLELDKKERMLQSAVESSNDGNWYIDLVENKMVFSKQWKRLLGYEEDELEDGFETFERLIHPDDRIVVLQVLDPYLKLGVGSYECEYRLRDKSGKYLWVLTKANVRYSENGLPLEFVATNTDITSRMEHKRQLAKSEAKYEGLIASIHEVIFTINKNGKLSFLGDAWKKHTGFDVDKTIGTDALKYIHPEDRDRGLKMLQPENLGAEEIHIDEELRFLDAQGNSIWMEVHGSILFDEKGEVSEINGTLVNINERKLEAKAKRASENKLSRISENISDLITEIDESGKYIFVSKAIRGMLGRNSEDILGTPSLLDVHPEDRDMVKRNLFDQLKMGARRVVEQYRVISGTGDYVWIETVIQPLISPSGTRTFIAASRDISARRRVEEEMKSALKKERDLNELKSRFITMTSHEFRTPLSNIQSSVQLLEMYAESLDENQEKTFTKHFNSISGQVERINNLLSNIETLGTIEEHDTPFNPVPQNIIEFVAGVIEQGVLPGRSIDLEVEGENPEVEFDPILMNTLLKNIFKNALLYFPEGVPVCTLKLNEKTCEILVKDEGYGIPSNELDHLFTSFFRARNIVNLNIPGNGLGLVIAKRITDLHKGSIEVDSEEEKGTLVTIQIPTKVH